MLVDIPFTCSKCQNKSVKSVNAPILYSDESDEHQYSDAEDEICCIECGTQFHVEIEGSWGNCFYTIADEDGEIVAEANTDAESYPNYYEDPDNAFHDEYYDEFEWFVTTELSRLDVLKNTLNGVRALLNEIDDQDDGIFKSVNAILRGHQELLFMAHGHVVAAFEGYLESTFIHNVVSQEPLLRQYILYSKDKNPKISLYDLVIKKCTQEQIIKNHLQRIIFHKLKTVVPMYKEIFGFEFNQEDKSWLGKAIALRHDCVHRAGRNKENELIEITNSSVLELIENIMKLSNNIEKSVIKKLTDIKL